MHPATLAARWAVAACALAAGVGAGCAIPVVSAGTFLPAGDLKKGDLHASVSLEVGRVLTSPSDVEAGTKPTPPLARQWEVSTWVASDVSLRYGLSERIQLEGQLKLTNPVNPFAPYPVGGAFGARVRLLSQSPVPGGGTEGFAIELAGRFVGVRADQELVQTQDTRSQRDLWSYRALGFELPLVVSYRISPLFAITGSPFLRAYWIRAWHDTTSNGGATTTATLQWTPVLSGGLGVSAAMDFGRVEIAPGLAFELGTRPGFDKSTQLLFEPGVSIGTRW